MAFQLHYQDKLNTNLETQWNTDITNYDKSRQIQPFYAHAILIDHASSGYLYLDLQLQVVDNWDS